jgi:hypothetical protein
MLRQFVQLAETRVKTAARQAAVQAALALVAALFALVALAAAFAALFFWLEPAHGATAAALICAGVALVLGLAAALPLAFKRRPAPAPPPPDALPQFMSLAAKTASALSPRQMVVVAALLGAALAFSARGKKDLE